MNEALTAACAKAIHVVTTEGQIIRAGRAAMFVLGRIGYPLTAKVAMLPPFIWAVELGYWIVATNRILFSKVMFKKE